MEIDSSQPVQADKYLQIMDLLKTQKILQEQLLELNIYTLLESENPVGNLFDGDNSEQELNKKLMTATTMLHMKELVLKKLQLGFILKQLLFNSDNSELSGLENVSYIRSLLSKQFHVTNDILKHHTEIQELVEEKYQLEKSCLDMKKSKNHLMDKLVKQHLDNKSLIESEEYKRYKEVLKDFLTRIQVLQVIFQNIIHGSGVHWQKNKQLLEIISKFGDNLPF